MTRRSYATIASIGLVTIALCLYMNSGGRHDRGAADRSKSRASDGAAKVDDGLDRDDRESATKSPRSSNPSDIPTPRRSVDSLNAMVTVRRRDTGAAVEGAAVKLVADGTNCAVTTTNDAGTCTIALPVPSASGSGKCGVTVVKSGMHDAAIALQRSDLAAPIEVTVDPECTLGAELDYKAAEAGQVVVLGGAWSIFYRVVGRDDASSPLSNQTLSNLRAVLQHEIDFHLKDADLGPIAGYRKIPITKPRHVEIERLRFGDLVRIVVFCGETDPIVVEHRVESTSDSAGTIPIPPYGGVNVVVVDRSGKPVRNACDVTCVDAAAAIDSTMSYCSTAKTDGEGRAEFLVWRNRTYIFGASNYTVIGACTASPSDQNRQVEITLVVEAATDMLVPVRDDLGNQVDCAVAIGRTESERTTFIKVGGEGVVAIPNPIPVETLSIEFVASGCESARFPGCPADVRLRRCPMQTIDVTIDGKHGVTDVDYLEVPQSASLVDDRRRHRASIVDGKVAIPSPRSSIARVYIVPAGANPVKVFDRTTSEDFSTSVDTRRCRRARFEATSAFDRSGAAGVPSGVVDVVMRLDDGNDDRYLCKVSILGGGQEIDLYGTAEPEFMAERIGSLEPVTLPKKRPLERDSRAVYCFSFEELLPPATPNSDADGASDRK